MSARRTTDRPTGARLGNVIRATFTSTLDLVTSPGVASASLQVSEHAAAEVDRTAPRACCLPANFLCFAAVGVAERESCQCCTRTAWNRQRRARTACGGYRPADIDIVVITFLLPFRNVDRQCIFGASQTTVWPRLYFHRRYSRTLRPRGCCSQ